MCVCVCVSFLHIYRCVGSVCVDVCVCVGSRVLASRIPG